MTDLDKEIDRVKGQLLLCNKSHQITLAEIKRLGEELESKDKRIAELEAKCDGNKIQMTALIISNRKSKTEIQHLTALNEAGEKVIESYRKEPDNEEEMFEWRANHLKIVEAYNLLKN